ncbi:unnamed protein product, partial [Brassica oleracea]
FASVSLVYGRVAAGLGGWSSGSSVSSLSRKKLDRSREPEPPLVSPSHNSCLPARLSPSVLDSQGADLLASGVTSVWSGLLCVMAGPGPSHPCFACCSFGVAFGTICGSSYCSLAVLLC